MAALKSHICLRLTSAEVLRVLTALDQLALRATVDSGFANTKTETAVLRASAKATAKLAVKVAHQAGLVRTEVTAVRNHAKR